jgi:hypothetical protein
VIVTPASDEHESAIARLVDQGITQLRLPGSVWIDGLAWKVPGGSYPSSRHWPKSSVCLLLMSSV